MFVKLAAVASVALVAITSATTEQLAASTDITPTNNSSTRELAAQAKPCYTYVVGTDIIGHDVGFLKADQPGTCQIHCANTGWCDMFTWTNYDKGRCWLKKRVSGGEVKATPKSGAYSFIDLKGGCVRADATFGKCEMTDSKYDVGSKQSSTPKSCPGLCATIARCTAWTWTPHNGGMCWLKSEPSACKPSNGGESGVIFLPWRG